MNSCLDPIYALQTWYLAEVLGVVSDHSQTMMASGNRYEYVKLSDSQSLTGKNMTNLCISCSPIIDDWKNTEISFYKAWFFHVFFYILTMQSSIGEFCNCHFRSKDFLLRRLRDMCPNTTTLMKIFNPRICIKNITFHSRLIIKVYFTIKRTTIVAMYHHLIVLFSFLRFRPDSFHFQKLREILIFCGRRCLLSWHYQFVSQPLAITLREGKALQVSPKIIQCNRSHKPISY